MVEGAGRKRRLHWLGLRGYDPVNRARPLKRVIQKDPIARKLLAGEIKDGEVVRVSAGEGGLAFGRAGEGALG